MDKNKTAVESKSSKDIDKALIKNKRGKEHNKADKQKAKKNNLGTSAKNTPKKIGTPSKSNTGVDQKRSIVEELQSQKARFRAKSTLMYPNTKLKMLMDNQQFLDNSVQDCFCHVIERPFTRDPVETVGEHLRKKSIANVELQAANSEKAFKDMLEEQIDFLHMEEVQRQHRMVAMEKMHEELTRMCEGNQRDLEKIHRSRSSSITPRAPRHSKFEKILQSRQEARSKSRSKTKTSNNSLKKRNPKASSTIPYRKQALIKGRLVAKEKGDETLSKLQQVEGDATVAADTA